MLQSDLVTARESTEPKPKRSLFRAIFLAAVLVALDGFLLNQGVVAFLVGVWLLFISLPLRLFMKRSAELRTQYLRDITVYFAAIALVFALNAANNQIASERAEVLVAAVNAFHARHQRYPDSLEELVPDFIERVPSAKYTLLFKEFWYVAPERDMDAELWYVEFPPFYRPTYDFTTNEWRHID